MKNYLRQLANLVDDKIFQDDSRALMLLNQILTMEADLLEEKSVRFLKKNRYVNEYLVNLVDESNKAGSKEGRPAANEVMRKGILDMKHIFGKRGIKILLRREFLRNLILDIEGSI